MGRIPLDRLFGRQDLSPRPTEGNEHHEDVDLGVEDIHNGLGSVLQWDQRANKLNSRKVIGEINHRIKPGKA